MIRCCLCLFPSLPKSGLNCFQTKEVMSNVMERKEGMQWRKVQGGGGRVPALCWYPALAAATQAWGNPFQSA